MSEPDEQPDEQAGQQPGPDAATEEIEADRAKRLSPENRPDNAEVDNTDRDFDAERGMYTDAEGYEEAEVKFPAEEQGA